MTAKKLNQNEWNDLFLEFWTIYPPRKGVRNGKAPSKKSWAKIKDKTLETFNAILKSVEYLKTTDDWKKEQGQFLPMPQTFLNQQRWEIEFTDDMEKAIADSFEPKEPKNETEVDNTAKVVDSPTKNDPKSVPRKVSESSNKNDVQTTVPKREPSPSPNVAPQGSLRQQYLNKIGY